MGNNQIANGICPSPSGEVRWGLDGSMRSNNNFYIKTKNIDKPKADYSATESSQRTSAPTYPPPKGRDSYSALSKTGSVCVWRDSYSALSKTGDAGYSEY